MEPQESELQRPIAVRWDPSQPTATGAELLTRLRLELDIERKKGLQLLQTLAQEKKRVFDLETRLIQNSIGREKVPAVASASSFASTEDSVHSRSWAPRAFSAESLNSDFLEEDPPRSRPNRSRSPRR